MAKGSGGTGKGKSGGAGASVSGAGAPLTVAGVEKSITKAYLDLTDGEYSTRVLLADLRPKLGLTREDFDSTLKSMQQQGKVVLMGLDNMMERTKRASDAALDIAGHPRHLVYFQKPGKR